ncbi:hypothetical protein [Miltoncostaea marina]|uniref:hypothetical protein n=1 Tax=Miltoncostaea marina TaxID=2843215 RepID=UPI001C3E0300|nr:hypothetical protein [Miltoncostaea marina]
MRTAADGILGALTGWAGDGALWLIGQVVKAIDTTTGVDVDARFFTRHYGFMVGVGGLLLLPLLLLAVVQALVRGDPAILVRAFFLQLPAAVLLTGLAVAATRTGLAVTDALSDELASGMAAEAEGFRKAFGAVVLSAGVMPAFVAFLVAVVVALATLAIWLELILRAAGIYIALMFLPLFLAAIVWPASARWARRLAELLVALVLAKLVMVACLSLGLSAIASGEGPGTVLAGAAIFVLAAFSPFVLLSLIPLAGEAAHLSRQGRPALGGASGGALVWQQARSRITGAAAAGGGVRAMVPLPLAWRGSGSGVQAAGAGPGGTAGGPRAPQGSGVSAGSGRARAAGAAGPPGVGGPNAQRPSTAPRDTGNAPSAQTSRPPVDESPGAPAAPAAARPSAGAAAAPDPAGGNWLGGPPTRPAARPTGDDVPPPPPPRHRPPLGGDG